MKRIKDIEEIKIKLESDTKSRIWAMVDYKEGIRIGWNHFPVEWYDPVDEVSVSVGFNKHGYPVTGEIEQGYCW